MNPDRVTRSVTAREVVDLARRLAVIASFGLEHRRELAVAAGLEYLLTG